MVGRPFGDDEDGGVQRAAQPTVDLLGDPVGVGTGIGAGEDYRGPAQVLAGQSGAVPGDVVQMAREIGG